MYTVTMDGTTINFNCENTQPKVNSQMTQIDSILVSFLGSTTINGACAKLRDGSIMNLYVSTYNIDKQQITIMPQYVPDPGQPATLNINQVSKIVIGNVQPGQESNLCK